MSQNIREAKRGTRLFEEGESIEKVFLIQSGRVNLLLERSGKKIEIQQVGAQQVLGDEVVFGSAKTLFTAEVATPIKYLEIPIAAIKGQLENINPGVRILVNSLTDENKKLKQFLKSYKLESAHIPFPEISVAKVFGGVALSVQHHGTRNEEGHYKLEWDVLKKYLVRYFGETPQKVMWALEILQLLKLSKLNYETNDEDEVELMSIDFFDIKRVEQFADFHQYYNYKPGRSEVLFVEDVALKAMDVILTLSEGVEPDFRGVTRMEYSDFLNKAKKQLGFEFKPLHLNVLEKKGIFVNRKSTDDNVFLELQRGDIKEIFDHWIVLNEVKYLNEYGVIRKKLEEDEKEISLNCSDCGSLFSEDQKFCSECGAKLAA